MEFFPQLGSGAVVQWPMERETHIGVLSDSTAGGRIWRKSRPEADGQRWHLLFEGLSVAEAAALEGHFRWAGGGLREFVFFDPLANLLRWSEELQDPVWLSANGLAIQKTGADPQRGTSWMLTNQSMVDQALSQSVLSRAGHIFCFSGELRGNDANSATLLAGSTEIPVRVGQEWGRYYVSGASEGLECAFGIRVPGGMSVEVRELQAEAQPVPSAYKPSGATSGIHTSARFGQQRLVITSTAPGRFEAEVEIWSPEAK